MPNPSATQQPTDKPMALGSGMQRSLPHPHRSMGIAALLLVLALAASSATAAPAARDEQLAAAFRIIAEAVDEGVAPGAGVLIVKDGEIVSAKAFGDSDLETSRPFELETIGWIASLTKPVTATAAMILADRGLLALDDPVEKYLPAFERQVAADGNHYPVTLRQLMSHSSGIQTSVPLRPRFFFAQPWFRRSLREVADAIAETKLTFTPGSKTEYSNAAPYVLGRIIEIQAKQPFGDFVRERILRPLEMTDTDFAIPANKIERAATSYRRDQGEAAVFCKFDPSWEVKMTMPDGGLFSTPGDIAKFASSFLLDRSPLLSGGSVEEMLTPQSDGYGLGWILDEPNQFSHWGSSGTLVWADRTTNVVGVVFFQMQDIRKIRAIQGRFRDAVTAAFLTP